MLSIHRFFGFPHDRRPSGSKRRAVLATECSSLRWMWPYNLRRSSLILSVIEAYPSLLRRSSLYHRMVRLVSPSDHWSIFIAMACRACSCFLVFGQHSTPYRANGLVDVHLKIFWYFQDSSDLSPLQPHNIDSYRMVTLSDMTRDPRYLNWVLFFQCWWHHQSRGQTPSIRSFGCWAAFHCPRVAFDFGAFASATSSAYDPPVCGRVWGIQNTGQLSLCPYKGWIPGDPTVTLKEGKVPAGHRTTLVTVQYSILTHLTYSFAFYCN